MTSFTGHQEEGKIWVNIQGVKPKEDCPRKEYVSHVRIAE